METQSIPCMENVAELGRPVNWDVKGSVTIFGDIYAKGNAPCDRKIKVAAQNVPSRTAREDSMPAIEEEKA
jgi:hypothetical protein